MNKLEKIKFGFRFDDDGIPDLYSYGEYRMGMTCEEIEKYIIARANKLNVKKLLKKFWEGSGCNTCASTSDGRMLMYRWDIQRHADVLFGKTNSTYFD